MLEMRPLGTRGRSRRATLGQIGESQRLLKFAYFGTYLYDLVESHPRLSQ